MSNDQSSSKRKPKFRIEPVRVSDQDQASVRRVLGRLSGRVPFPEEAEVSATPRVEEAQGNVPAPGISPAPGDSITPGKRVAPGDDPAPRTLPAPGKRTAPRRSADSGGKVASAKQVAARTSATVSDLSPRRDFTKTPNSIIRDVLSRGLFRGKSRDIYDFLYSKTRGAIVPRVSALLTTKEIMSGASVGSDHTLRDNLRHLKLVGLVDCKVNSGAQDGNEYFVYLPEEVSLPFDRDGNPLQVISPPQVTSPGHPGQELPGAPGAETAGGAGGSSVAETTTSGGPKTSFKTIETKTDDEAFAGMVSLLRQAAAEVTGKETGAAERERWNEVAELLITELKVAASRTTVSSAPAFLAEHLRRRLRKTDARQIEREVVEASSKQPAVAAKPELTAEQIQEQVNLMAGLMRDGAEVRELEEQFAANFRPSQWHMIRSIALAQASVPTTKPNDTEQ